MNLPPAFAGEVHTWLKAMAEAATGGRLTGEDFYRIAMGLAAAAYQEGRLTDAELHAFPVLVRHLVAWDEGQKQRPSKVH